MRPSFPSGVQAFTLCALALFTASQSTTAQTIRQQGERGSGSITGRITIGQKPASGIDVALFKLDANSSQRTAVTKVKAADDGTYEFVDLAPGHYDVLPLNPLMVVPREGGFAQSGMSVTVDSGEATKGVDFDLVPGGVISGRVTDTAGNPVIEQRVELYQGESRPLYRITVNPNLEFMTDDRGVYRIYGIPPGRYLVSVGVPSVYKVVSQRGAYEQTFHPAAREPARAKAIEIPVGGEAAGVDIIVQPPPKTYEVTGRIIESATGRPLTNVGVNIVFESEEGGRSDMGGWRSNNRGEFSIGGVLPGQYRIYPENQAASNTFGEPVSVTVSDANVRGLEIKMRRASRISGVIVMEGGNQSEIAKKLALWDVIAYDMTTQRQSARTKIETDGSFRLSGIRPGQARVNLSPNRPGVLREFTLLRIERNGEVLIDEIEIGQEEEISGLKLFLGRSGGSIRGQVKVEGGALEGVHLYLNYRRSSDAPNSYRRAELDSRGRFVIEWLMEGEYELMIGPMTVNVTSEAGGKTMGRMATVVKKITVTPGATAEATLVLTLAPER